MPKKEPCTKCGATGFEFDKPLVEGKVRTKEGMVKDVVKSSYRRRCSACLGKKVVDVSAANEQAEVDQKLASINKAREARGEKPIVLG